MKVPRLRVWKPFHRGRPFQRKAKGEAQVDRREKEFRARPNKGFPSDLADSFSGASKKDSRRNPKRSRLQLPYRNPIMLHFWGKREGHQARVPTC